MKPHKTATNIKTAPKSPCLLLPPPCYTLPKLLITTYATYIEKFRIFGKMTITCSVGT